MWRDQFRQESELRQILSAMKAKRCALRGIAGNCMAQFIDIDYRHQFDGWPWFGMPGAAAIWIAQLPGHRHWIQLPCAIFLSVKMIRLDGPLRCVTDCFEPPNKGVMRGAWAKNLAGTRRWSARRKRIGAERFAHPLANFESDMNVTKDASPWRWPNVGWSLILANCLI